MPRHWTHRLGATAMWRLACENATYRVHLVPKMSARVETVE